MRLTREEILLVTCILLALVGGATVKHYRDRDRARMSAAQPATSSPEP